MSWHQWADDLRQSPQKAVADLLNGAAEIGPFERAEPHDFLLAVLPRTSRSESRTLLGEPRSTSAELDPAADLPHHVDSGLLAWMLTQRLAPQPPARKLGAYVAQVCEALQWPMYFALPQSRAALRADRAQWLRWLGSLTLTAFRDPEYDYWQVLASYQADDQMQFFWQSFVVEAGRTRSARYLNLGLLALARLPLSDENSLRNLRLQVQALISRYQRRKSSGTPALDELAQALRRVMARNPSLNAAGYGAFFTAMLVPLGDDKTASVLSLLGLANALTAQRQGTANRSTLYKLVPPGLADETDEAVRTVRQSVSLVQAWQVVRPLLSAHEDFLHKSGDAYYFVRTLDMCARALCSKYTLRDREIQSRLFEWIRLALRLDADNPRLWMLWELALRNVGYPQRAQWVLWEMTRRFPDQLPCRVELARLLAESNSADDMAQAHRLLHQVLQLDPDNLHAHSTLAQLAIRQMDWNTAFVHCQRGLRIDPQNESCAVLLATAYAKRNGPDDLQTAIEHLQRFVARYPGQMTAEGYLRSLQRRQQLAAQGQQPAHEVDDQPARTEPAPLETDPAWRTFADSIGSWVAASTSGDLTAPGAELEPMVDRVLPLPQAFQQAVARGQWDADVVERYDATTQQEFPLETRLWRYLQTLGATSSTESERDRAKLALQAWGDAETHAPTQSSASWPQYLNKQLDALNGPADLALAAGAEWLKDLLDRYQPLPAPLFS